MEKLTFKNKLSQYLSLSALVGAGVLTLVGLIASLIMMFMDLGKDKSIEVLTYICLGFILVSFIVTLVILGIYLRTVKKGIQKNTFKILDVSRLILSSSLLIFAVLFFIDNTFVKASGGDVGFFKVDAIVTFAVEIVALFYRIWRMLWVKENPDRIYNTYVLKEPDGYEGEGDVKEIGQGDVKQIEHHK